MCYQPHGGWNTLSRTVRNHPAASQFHEYVIEEELTIFPIDPPKHLHDPKLEIWKNNASSLSSTNSQISSGSGISPSSRACSGASFDDTNFIPEIEYMSVALYARPGKSWSTRVQQFVDGEYFSATTSQQAACPGNSRISPKTNTTQQPQKKKKQSRTMVLSWKTRSYDVYFEVTFKRLQENSLSQSTIPSAKRGLTILQDVTHTPELVFPQLPVCASRCMTPRALE